VLALVLIQYHLRLVVLRVPETDCGLV
jgi:hypothetical protein